MDKKLVSVVMPIYNREAYLSEAIQSIVAQSYTNWELILIDDGSTDHSLEIANQWKKSDSRIQLLCNETNLGISASRNHGIAESHGEYIAFLDSDDIAEWTRIEQQVDLIESGFDMVGSSVTFIDENNAVIGEERVATNQKDIQYKMQFTLPLPNPTLLARKAVFIQVGGYRFSCAEDYDFFLRAFDWGFKFTNLSAPLVRMRMHFNNTGVLHVRKQRLLTKLAWKLHEERLQFGEEKTDWKACLATFQNKSCVLEQRAAHYYRKAYVLQNRRKFACAGYLLLACLIWPSNLLHLLRRFL
jgi:glycosyltransferase involved in cell wall biosynthesis